MPVQYLPKGYHHITPYLIVPNAAQLIEFLKTAFSGQVTEYIENEGRVMHAQVKIGDSSVMMGEPQGDFQPMPASLYLYVEDTDQVYKRCLESGATSVMEPADQFYGDRNAGIKDAAGNLWWIATHIEDVSSEELQKHAKERK